MARTTSSEGLRRETRPYRIGILDDIPGVCGDALGRGVELGIEDARARGLMDRPVELVARHYFAQPYDTGRPNVEAYRELVAEGVLAVVGPHTTDNALALLPELARLQVPSIAICGSQEYAGPFAFTVPNGGMADEPAVVAAWLRAAGHRSVAVVRDSPSQIGEEYVRHFRISAREHGLDVVAEQGVSPLATREELAPLLERLRALGADCLAYWGLGALCRRMTDSLEQIGWSPPRVMGTAFVGASFSEASCRAYEGWHGLDQFHEESPVLRRLAARYEERYGEPLTHPTSVLTCGFDAGQALARGLDRMRIATPESLRDALETVTRVPAATGAPGTVVTFSKRDHRALKGAHYLFVRRSEGGRNLYVGTAPLAD